MKTLFLILPFPSHYTAVFPFANKLKAKGESVLFSGTDRYKELVEKNGFTFAPFSYGHEYTIHSLKAFLGLFIMSRVSKQLFYENYHNFLMQKNEIEKLIKNYSIKRVFIDEHLSDFYFFFLTHNIEVQLVNTKLSTKKRPSDPKIREILDGLLEEK